MHAGEPLSLWWRLIRFGFRLLYNELAWTYDLVSWVVSLGQWQAWQRASLPHLAADEGCAILEIAHGTGSLQTDLIRAGYRATGLDLSRMMGWIAQRKLRKISLPARLVRGSATQLPFPDEAFHGAVSTFPTEFIIHPDTVSEVHRVLKPGGRFVVVPGSLLTGRGLVAKFLEWLYRITGQRGPWPSEALSILEQTDFSIRILTEELPRSKVWIVIAEKESS